MQGIMTLLKVMKYDVIEENRVGHERKRKLLFVPKGQWVFFTVKRVLEARHKRGL